VVVDKGDQVCLSVPIIDKDFRAVHDVGLPDVVGQFGLELAPVTAPPGRPTSGRVGLKTADAGVASWLAGLTKPVFPWFG